MRCRLIAEAVRAMCRAEQPSAQAHVLELGETDRLLRIDGRPLRYPKGKGERGITCDGPEGHLLIALARGRPVPLTPSTAVTHLRAALHVMGLQLKGRGLNLRLVETVKIGPNLGRARPT